MWSGNEPGEVTCIKHRCHLYVYSRNLPEVLELILHLEALIATHSLPCSCRLGLLQVGDRILSINGVRMEGVMLQQALKFVQEAGDVIEMEVEFDVTGKSCDIM